MWKVRTQIHYAPAQSTPSTNQIPTKLKLICATCDKELLYRISRKSEKRFGRYSVTDGHGLHIGVFPLLRKQRLLTSEIKSSGLIHTHTSQTNSWTSSFTFRGSENQTSCMMYHCLPIKILSRSSDLMLPSLKSLRLFIP